MPNQREHAKDGAIVGGCLGITVALIQAKSQGQPAMLGDIAALGLVGVGIGAISGIVPDILEPPNHPNHRRSFHSPELAIGLISTLVKAMGNDQWRATALALGIPAIAGYSAHLLKDAQTPKGLPRLL